MSGVSTLTVDVALDLGLPSWASTLLGLGIGFTVCVIGGRLVVHGPDGQQIGDGIEVGVRSNIGYPVDNIVISDRPGLWTGQPMPRGTAIDTMLDIDVGRTFSTYDHFDVDTGQAVSVKSLDTSCATYQTQNGLYNKLKSYVDVLDDFKGDTTDSGLDVDPTMIRSRVVDVAIPDRPLTPAQIAAFDEFKTYAATEDVSVVITVVRD